MSGFLEYDESTSDGRIAELYEIYAAGNYYRYTSGAEPVVRLGGTYSPAPLERTTLSSGNDPAQSGMTLTGPHTLEVAQLFRTLPPSEVVTLHVFARHLDDPDGEFVVVWAGRVLNARWAGSRVDLICEDALTSQRRTGLRRVYDTVCPHVLYGYGCTVNADAYVTNTVNYTLTGRNLYVPALVAAADGYFAGGYIEYYNGITGAIEFIAIRWSAGGNLTMALPPPGVTTQNLKIRPGCNHTTSDCETKFNNLLNYGGQPDLPLKNPFGGTQLF